MIGKRHGWDGGQTAHLRRRQAPRRRQAWGGGDIRRGGVAGILEHVLHRAALHPGIRPPRATGIFVALKVAIVGGIGVDDDSGGSPLLRQVDFDPAEVHSVANQHDFPGNTDVHVVELLEVLRTPVIDIDHIGGEVTGRGRAVKGGQHAGIILVRVIVDMLPGGPGHEDFAVGVGGLQKDLLGQIHPGLVRNDLGIQAGRLELAGHIKRGIVILFAGGNVGHGGERFQLFLGQLWVGNGEELLVDFRLPGEVAVAKDSIRKRRNLGPNRCVKRWPAENRGQIAWAMGYLSVRESGWGAQIKFIGWGLLPCRQQSPAVLTPPAGCNGSSVWRQPEYRSGTAGKAWCWGAQLPWGGTWPSAC